MKVYQELPLVDDKRSSYQSASRVIHHHHPPTIVTNESELIHPREMMIINCNDNTTTSSAMETNGRISMSVSVTPVQEHHQPMQQHQILMDHSVSRSSQVAGTNVSTTTTTIHLPLQMTSSNDHTGSGGVSTVYYEHPAGHSLTTRGSGADSNGTSHGVEEIVILSGTLEEQYQHLSQVNSQTTPVIEVGNGVGVQSYDRIIMVSPSTSKLETSSCGQLQLTAPLKPSSSASAAGRVKPGTTIISLVSKEVGVYGEGAGVGVVMLEDRNGSGDGKISTTTTRERHGLKGAAEAAELDADGDDVFKFVLDEVEGPPESLRTNTRQLRSSGTKDPMLGSGGMEILMLDSNPVVLEEEKRKEESVVIVGEEKPVEKPKDQESEGE